MGIYSNLVIPYCIDLAMSGSNLEQYRPQLLKDVTGDILEVGFWYGIKFTSLSRWRNQNYDYRPQSWHAALGAIADREFSHRCGLSGFKR